MSKSLFSYFKPLSKKEGEELIDKVEVILPDPNGPLSQEVPPPVIAEANKDVLAAMQYVEPKKKGPYIKISPECKAKSGFLIFIISCMLITSFYVEQKILIIRS